MKEAISGTHGFIGRRLHGVLPQAEPLDRTGIIFPNVDVVYDIAGYGNMAHHTDVKEIYNANLLRVITAMDYIGEAKYIYISTSSVGLPVQTYYSASKKAAEEYLKVTGKNVAIARPFSVTGVGEQEEHLIPKLIDSCLNGTHMNFVPEPVHDFIDVEDFCNALIAIRDKGQFKGEVYEVGSGKQTSNDEVRLMIEGITGKKANITVVDSIRNYDTKNWCANNERISALGWKPKKTLEQTLTEMIYARKNN
jgi:nucleoside-diphosphate-sugar epimerase